MEHWSLGVPGHLLRHMVKELPCSSKTADTPRNPVKLLTKGRLQERETVGVKEWVEVCVGRSERG